MINKIKSDLEKDGFTIVRNIIPKEDVLRTRNFVSGLKYEELLNEKHFSNKELKVTTEHKNIIDIMREIYNSLPAQAGAERVYKDFFITFKKKWMRQISKGQFTKEHIDYFKKDYFGMLTVWIPLGDYKEENSVLYLKKGSHKMDIENIDELKDIPIYKSLDAPTLPLSAERVYMTDYKMGDIVIFDIRTSHGSTINKTDEIRYSVECRWVKYDFNKYGGEYIHLFNFFR